MAADGYIKLHRKILDWEWFQDPNTLTLFIYLLAKANHKAKKWQGQTIERGQLVTSFAKMSEETGLSVRNVRTALAHLESTGEVTRKATNKRQTITVENYTSYQGGSPRADNQTTTNKNDKNKQEDIYKSSVNIYPKDIGEQLTDEDRDRLTDIYSDLEGLVAKVNERIKTRKRQTEIKDPYSYIVRAARDMEWPTKEAAEKKNAKRKKNLEEKAKAEKPPELTPEQKAKAKAIRERRQRNG